MVRSRKPPRALSGAGETREIVGALLVAIHLVAVVVKLARGNRDGGVEHIGAELLLEPIGDFFARPAVARVVLNHVEQNATQDRLFVLPIAGEDDGDVRRMGEVGKACAFPDLAVMVLRGEGEGMVDAIGVAVHPWDRDRGESRGVLWRKLAEWQRTRERIRDGLARRSGDEGHVAGSRASIPADVAFYIKWRIYELFVTL